MRNKSATANARQKAFAKLRVEGLTQASAYRAVYNPGAKDRAALEAGCRLEANPLVRAEMDRLRALSQRKTLLTLNDRLSILANIAQEPSNAPGMANAKTRAIDVYSKISGDQAPQRVEVTGKDGAAIPIAATALVARLPIRERARLLREAKERDKQARTAESTAPERPPPRMSEPVVVKEGDGAQ